MPMLIWLILMGYVCYGAISILTYCKLIENTPVKN